jgi:hypothetical protein
MKASIGPPASGYNRSARSRIGPLPCSRRPSGACVMERARYRLNGLEWAFWTLGCALLHGSYPAPRQIRNAGQRRDPLFRARKASRCRKRYTDPTVIMPILRSCGAPKRPMSTRKARSKRCSSRSKNGFLRRAPAAHQKTAQIVLLTDRQNPNCCLKSSGGRTRARTWDPLIKSQLL